MPCSAIAPEKGSCYTAPDLDDRQRMLGTSAHTRGREVRVTGFAQTCDGARLHRVATSMPDRRQEAKEPANPNWKRIDKEDSSL